MTENHQEKPDCWKIETERLTIRRAVPTDQDVAFLYELWTNPEVMKNVGFPHGLRTDPKSIEAQVRNGPDGEYDCVLVVVLISSGELIGQAKLGSLDSNMVAHTDIKLLPRYWGNRYGVEIKRVLLEYLFAYTKCTQVRADPNVNNAASIRLQEAVGGRKTGEGVYRFPEEMREYTEDVHYAVYTVFRDDCSPA